MFERRLRLILWILGLAMIGLVARAGQIQVLQQGRWSQEAADLLTLRQPIETTRGSILDCRGRLLAVDEPCMDACVDYRAITDEPDADWMHDQALAMAKDRYESEFTSATRARRKEMVEAEIGPLRAKIAAMWQLLAKVSGQTPEQIGEIRRSIVQRVELRRQYVWWQNYQQAVTRQKQTAGDKKWYSRWLPGDDQAADHFDDYDVEVGEQFAPHVIVPGLSTDQYNTLAKDAENCPGLVLRPGLKRYYPFGASACHVLGYLSAVRPEQIKNDDDGDPQSRFRKYWPNDLAGQAGVEALCEGTLRGSRGETISDGNSNQADQTIDPIPGKDVRLTIDIELEQEIEQAFAKHRDFYNDGDLVESRENQPGAAVVIDVQTGHVLALISYPTFDLNTLAADYSRLRADELNDPLMDRAAGGAYEPGSTVKPLMGMGALTDGLITPRTTIECNGYLVLGGHTYTVGRCWTMREYHLTHHDIPPSDPLPTNSLTVVDAIERSCNVFFETVADHMKMERQRYWYQQFGLGRPTGIGLPEISGRIPDPQGIPPSLLRMQTWFTGIGQGLVAATPIQMANAIATVARGGIWMRPRIVEDADVAPTADWKYLHTGPDQVNLNFSLADLTAVREGMIGVVNSPAGTGQIPHDEALNGVIIAGKTGTAQASALTVPLRDMDGNVVLEDGHPKRVKVDPNNPEVKNWYIGGGTDKNEYAHHWFIGFAPADHPRIAFAVFAEYGGSGSPVATNIARDLVESCVKHGYVTGQ